MGQHSADELRCNVRVHWLLMFPYLGLQFVGLAMVVVALQGSRTPLGLLGGACCVIGAGGVLRRAIAMRKPRLRIEDDFVRVNLGKTSTEVPIDVVECFFLGQGPTNIPTQSGDPMESSNVIVRLAESAQEWHRRDVTSALGSWCEGYITLKGTWCEPISLELVNRLNHQLAATKRDRKARSA